MGFEIIGGALLILGVDSRWIAAAARKPPDSLQVIKHAQATRLRAAEAVTS